MIKFFRHIRKSLIHNNKIGTYFKYAVGEIILVVIGILIALQINNWNEKRKKHELSQAALIELQEEIKTTKFFLENKNKVNELATDIMKGYLEDQYNNPSDSLKNRVVGYSFAYNPIQLSIPILEREISANGIIIGHATLKDKLQAFKDTQIIADQLKFYLDNFWNKNVITYLKDQELMLSFVSKAGLIDKDVEGLATLYDSSAFKDLVAMEYMHVSNYTQRIKQLQNMLTQIDKDLDNILND